MKKLIIIACIALTSCQMEEKKATYTGLDFKGNSKTCSQMKEAACTEIYTEADDYAMKCKKEGKKVIQCDCHDFICLDE